MQRDVRIVFEKIGRAGAEHFDRDRIGRRNAKRPGRSFQAFTEAFDAFRRGCHADGMTQDLSPAGRWFADAVNRFEQLDIERPFQPSKATRHGGLIDSQQGAGCSITAGLVDSQHHA